MTVRLDGLAIGDDAASLTSLGLDAADGCTSVGGVTLRAVGTDAGRGIRTLSLDGATGEGLPVGPVEPCPHEHGPHPIGAVAVDHVVVLAGDVLGAIAAAGLEPRRVEERGDRRYAYVVASTALLEFVGPVETDDRPPRPWGLALSVEDLDAACVWLGDAAGTPKDAFQPGRRIVTVRHEQLGLSVPTVLLTPR